MAKAKAKAAKFTPFPVPKGSGDAPLVRHAGPVYECTGCGGAVPDGAWLAESVVDGMVVGLVATAGQGGAVVHECGDRR